MAEKKPKHNGPYPSLFQTCICCKEEKQCKHNFPMSRHYSSWFHPICFVCRQLIRDGKLEKPFFSTTRAQPKDNTSKEPVLPRMSSKKEAAANLTDALLTWR